MNSPIGQKNRPWRARVSFRNGESSVALTIGMPVVLKAGDESAVVSPNTGASAAVNHALFAGLLAADSVAAGQYGDVVVAGYHQSARVLRMTRADSTSPWASFPAIATGDYFTIESVNNCIQRSGAGAASAGPFNIVAVQSLASATTLASDAATGTVPQSATALTMTCKVWVRALS